MILKSLSLKNFRIHTDTQIEFSPQINYIIGGNGQGKTSILEAIYYLCTTKNSTSQSDIHSVKFNQNEFVLNGIFSGATDNEVRVVFRINENKKYYFHNNKQVHRASEIIGKYPVVILTPSDHSITQGSPAERRKFVDSVISQTSETYLQLLLDYNRTLKQRSSLLSQLKEERRKSTLEELDAWSNKLSVTGADLIKYRIQFTEDFNLFIKNSYNKIINGSELPAIKYSYFDENVTQNIQKDFFNLLLKRKEEEIRRGTNLVGPHRDDFIFSIDGINLREFGSQGQHKTFQVALRFAQFFYIKEKNGRTPLFLLDDVFGELDTNRSVNISNYLKHIGQAFITLTDFSNFTFLYKNESDKILNIKNGSLANA